MLALDGVYAEGGDGFLRFHEAGSPSDDGTSHIIFKPHELMERLVALVPAPRFNMIRYSGVFASVGEALEPSVGQAPEPPDANIPCVNPKNRS